MITSGACGCHGIEQCAAGGHAKDHCISYLTQSQFERGCTLDIGIRKQHPEMTRQIARLAPHRAKPPASAMPSHRFPKKNEIALMPFGITRLRSTAGT
jgi:hypothetical protein